MEVIIMSTNALTTPRFLRKTVLAENEYRINFRQVDNDVIEVITSREADAVTPLMSKIYLKLVNAPSRYFEGPGVLRFEEESREDKRLTAWQILCDLLGVSSSTASKAIKFMKAQSILGYFSGKNGVGIRIFLNRASSSIRVKHMQGAQKILTFSPASNGSPRTTVGEAAFNGRLENLDINRNYRAPKTGADQCSSDKILPDQNPHAIQDLSAPVTATKIATSNDSDYKIPFLGEIISRLKMELEPVLRLAAIQAAAREHERTREWLENRGIPKAARVAQREAFKVLRSQGIINSSGQRARAELTVGQHTQAPYKPRFLSPDEIREIAEICISMLEGHNQAIDVTLADISIESGGYLLAEDAPKVRELAQQLALRMSRKE
jgi:hypothetical protein